MGRTNYRKADFLERMRDGRQRLDAALSGLSEDQLTQEMVAGEWSAKDMLAHIAAWDTATLAAVQRATRDEAGAPLISADLDAWNCARVQERRVISLAEQRRELEANRAALLAALESWPEDSVPLGPDGWDETAQLWWLTEHDGEHADILTAWRARAG
jgi:uncharacterized damage-inducible protein DinB